MCLFRLLRITITFMLTFREASSKFDIFRSPQRLLVGMLKDDLELIIVATRGRRNLFLGA